MLATRLIPLHKLFPGTFQGNKIFIALFAIMCLLAKVAGGLRERGGWVSLCPFWVLNILSPSLKFMIVLGTICIPQEYPFWCPKYFWATVSIIFCQG